MRFGFTTYFLLVVLASCQHKDYQPKGEWELSEGRKLDRPEDRLKAQLQEAERSLKLPTNPGLGVNHLSKNCSSVSMGEWVIPHSCQQEYFIRLELRCKVGSEGGLWDFDIPLRYRDVIFDLQNETLKNQLKGHFPLKIQTSDQGIVQFSIVQPESSQKFDLIILRNNKMMKVSESMLAQPIILDSDFCQ